MGGNRAAGEPPRPGPWTHWCMVENPPLFAPGSLDALVHSGNPAPSGSRVSKTAPTTSDARHGIETLHIIHQRVAHSRYLRNDNFGERLGLRAALHLEAIKREIQRHAVTDRPPVVLQIDIMSIQRDGDGTKRNQRASNRKVSRDLSSRFTAQKDAARKVWKDYGTSTVGRPRWLGRATRSCCPLDKCPKPQRDCADRHTCV